MGAVEVGEPAEEAKMNRKKKSVDDIIAARASKKEGKPSSSSSALAKDKSSGKRKKKDKSTSESESESSDTLVFRKARVSSGTDKIKFLARGDASTLLRGPDEHEQVSDLTRVG